MVFDITEKKQELFADLHIHSRFSRACSKDLNLTNLVKWARIKGLGLLGTGDFTHPKWLEELKENLKERKGVYYFKDEKGEFPFILTGEISLMYLQDGKGRKVHLVLLVPNLEIVDKINSWLDTKGRRDYDGRPIFGMSARDFVAKMEEIDEKIEVIPAHIWTPYFGVFGSKSGFNSLTDAFLDKVNRIHAIETGISSDPEMNWKISELENYAIVSFSDSHSFWPWRLGREATIFNLNEELSYDFIINQIRNKTYKATIETDPAYGMYHFDGHRDCNFSSSPKQTKELGGICPVCKKPLTIGVENRVNALSNTSFGYMPKNMKPFYKMLPLHEIIALAINVSMNSKAVWKIYNELIEKFGNEFNILLDAKTDELSQVIKNDFLIELIMKNRIGNIKVKPGYDGTYGIPILKKHEEQEKLF
ncbi:MAG: endonuclease Q family protein [Candidatus Pacearchaeota archaeon]